MPFEKIFNNESIKYDVFDKNFYIFKGHGRDKAQIRIKKHRKIGCSLAKKVVKFIRNK